MQKNGSSHQAYQGQNQVDLSVSAHKNGYTSNEWVTFLQAKELGRKIKKGEHGMHIFKGFGEFADVTKNKEGKQETRFVSRPIGMATVFNLDQTELVEQSADYTLVTSTGDMILQATHLSI